MAIRRLLGLTVAEAARVQANCQNNSQRNSYLRCLPFVFGDDLFCELLTETLSRGLLEIKEIEYTGAIAHNSQEALQLINVGFQFVQTIGDEHLYRKLK